MKQFYILLATLFTGLTLSAQTITTLDWNEMRIDSVMPHYTEVVPLAKDYARYDFKVLIEYASWARLTPAEELAARQHIDEIADTVIVNTYIGASRGEGSLDIDFIPIVYDKDKDELRKLLQCKLTIAATEKPMTSGLRKASTSKQRWASQSVLASGTWHKIAVEEDGVYALTPALLAKMGIKNPARAKVYGYGGHMLSEVMNADVAFDDLEEIPLLRRPNGDMLFWANGVYAWDWTVTVSSSQHHTLNPYSTRGYYFVTEGDDPAVLETEESTTSGGTLLTSFTGYWIRDIDEYAYFTGGRRLWENKTLNGANGRTYQINTPGYLSGTATLRISVANGGKVDCMLESTFNDSALVSTKVSVPGEYEKAGSTTKYFTLRGLKKGSNTLRLKANNDRVFLDYIELNYSRSFDMTESTLPFYLNQSGAVRFMINKLNDNQDIVLMRIGTRGRPAVLIEKNASGYYAVKSAKGDYVAIDLNGTYASPVYAGRIENQNLHADDNVDMVIITPASGIHDREAQRLADAHALYDGLKCRVVRADKIYNEFSSGTPDATAYRRYMKMLYDRALESGQEPPRNLLLFGDAIWDNRMLTPQVAGKKQDNFLLCFESANSLSDTQSYVMEDYFGLLDDGEGGKLSSDKVDIGIGRFPAQTVDEGRVMVDKVIEHLKDTDPGKWQNLALFLGDDGDNNEHMKYACQVADTISKYAPAIDARKIMWDTYKRVSTTTGNSFPLLTQYINNTVNEGAIMFNYVGHGATYLLSHENVLSLADFRTYDNTRQGFWFTAACDIMPFDGLVDNIGEAAVLNPRGGARCFIGTARTVYANLNFNINKEFCRFIFNADPETGRRYSIGEALRLAKNALTESGSTVNKLHYSILGDPSLVFGQPTRRIVVDKINDTDINETSPNVKAGSRCTFEGHVEDAEGIVLNDFNGLLDARILDSMDSVVCLNQAGDTTAFKYGAHRKVLFEGTDSIKQGQFKLSFVVPMDINYANRHGHAIFYAKGKNADGATIAANGYTERYIVGGTSDEMNGDKQGPKIDVWLESETFMNGAHVSTSPMLFANIEDESGMNFTSAGIGHGLEVCVDDKADLTFDVSKNFTFESGNTQRGSLTYQLPVLSKGEHSLRLRAWDVLNNTNAVTITFNVSGTNEAAPISTFINSDENGNNTITIVNRLTGSSCDATVHLFDATGHVCFTTDVNGIGAGDTTYLRLPSSTLASGIYFLQVSMNQGAKHYQSEIQKVILNF